MSNPLEPKSLTFTRPECMIIFESIKYEIDDIVNLPFTQKHEDRLQDLFPIFWELFSLLYSEQLKALDKCPSSHSTK